MNRKSFSLLSLALVGVSALVAIGVTSTIEVKAMKVGATPGPTDEIASVSFVENEEIGNIYTGRGGGLPTDYKVNQTVNISGINWKVSAAAYGENHPNLVTQTAGYNTLFFSSSLGKDDVANTYSIYFATLPGIYADTSDDYSKIIAHTGYTYNVVFMSEDILSDVTDIGVFWHYATASPDHVFGVIPLIKIKGTTEWVRPYNSAGVNGGGLVYYEDTGYKIENVGITRTDKIANIEFNRVYDGCYYYNDAPYGNFAGKEFQLAFVFYANGAASLDVEFDGIIVNRHQTAMKLMNSLNDKTICGSGNIDDKNVIKSFELLDRAFNSAYYPGGSDVNELEQYAIDSKYTNLREGNYLAQYNYLKSKIVKEKANITFTYNGNRVITNNHWLYGGYENSIFYLDEFDISLLDFHVSPGVEYTSHFEIDENIVQFDPLTPATYAFKVKTKENDKYAANTDWVLFKLIERPQKQLPTITFKWNGEVVDTSQSHWVNVGWSTSTCTAEEFASGILTYEVSEGAQYTIQYEIDEKVVTPSDPIAPATYAFKIIVAENEYFASASDYVLFTIV